MSKQSFVDITERDLVEIDLLLSGYTPELVTSLTEHLNDTEGAITRKDIADDRRLEVAQSLGAGWLTRRLRVLADGDNPEIAVAALEQLVKLSLSGRQSDTLLNANLFTD